MSQPQPHEETLDNVYRYVGRFGRIQKRAVAFCVLISITVGYQNVCPVFTLRTPRHRCRLPHLENDSYTLQNDRHFEDVLSFTPLDSDGNYEKCFVWKYEGNTTDRHKERCSSWVYEDNIFSRTLATDLDLVCDDTIMRSTSSMLLFAGKLFGAILQGYASDRYGRRRCIIVCTIAMFGCTLGNGFVNSVPLLLAFRFLTGTATTATFLLAFVLCVELLDSANRTIVSTSMRLSFAVGQLSLAGIAYYLRDWQQFQLALVWPAVVSILGLCFVIESPRWLLSRKLDDKAHKVFRHMARINGTELPDSMLPQLVIVDKEKKESPFSLYREPRLAIRWFILYFNWIVIVAVYYGLTLNVSNMSGDIFLNFFLVTSVDIVATLLTGLVVNKLSRKYFHVTMMMVSGLVLASSFIPVITFGPDWIVILISMVGKFTISSAFYLVYIYSAELFPTSHRSFGMGSCSMSGRLGGIASPYLADLALFVDGPFGQALPQVVCGVLGICGALAALVLPETRGRPLPETIEDAKNFTNHRKVQVDKEASTKL